MGFMGSGAIKGLSYALMFLNLGILLYLFKQQKIQGKKVGAVLGIVLSVVAIGCALVIIKIDGWSADRMRKRIAAQEARYQYVGFKRLGQEIAKRHEGAKVLVILQKAYELAVEDDDAVDRTKPFAESQWEALKDGLGDACTIQAIEEVRLEMDYEMMEMPIRRSRSPQEKIFTAKVFDNMLKKHAGVDLVVLLAGLPVDYQEMAIWEITEPEKRPALVLANSSPYQLKNAIRKNYVSIMLVNHMWTDSFTSPVPDDELDAFNKRYLLVTPDSVDELARKHPKLF